MTFKKWNTMSTDNDDHLNDQRGGALDYRGCRTRQIIRYVELEDRHRVRLAGDS